MTDYKRKKDISLYSRSEHVGDFDSFVLEKSIFSKVFEKDIRRVYIYKKSERLAKAVHLICPAFISHPALKDKIDAIAIGLVEAAILPPASARTALSRELLTLSSVLSIAKSGGALSTMNAELIAREAHLLLQEIAMYEEPKVTFETVPTLASFMKQTDTEVSRERSLSVGSSAYRERTSKPLSEFKGHVKDRTSRQDAILSTIRTNGPSFIKDISVVIRDVSEKTIQRELQSLVLAGLVMKEGNRRWTKYSLVSS